MPASPLNWLDLDAFDVAGNGPRFVMVGEEDGSWTVIDQATQMPAIWDDKMLFGLTFEMADNMVETMNQILAATGRE